MVETDVHRQRLEDLEKRINRIEDGCYVSPFLVFFVQEAQERILKTGGLWTPRYPYGHPAYLEAVKSAVERGVAFEMIYEHYDTERINNDIFNLYNNGNFRFWKYKPIDQPHFMLIDDGKHILIERKHSKFTTNTDVWKEHDLTSFLKKLGLNKKRKWLNKKGKYNTFGWDWHDDRQLASNLDGFFYRMAGDQMLAHRMKLTENGWQEIPQPK